MTVNNVEYRIENIYHDEDMYGRGTVCYKGTSQVDGSIVVIKDQWTDFPAANKELEILKRLNEGEESSVCTPDGVRVIPKVIAGNIVSFKKPSVVEVRFDGENKHCVQGP